ncbi:Major facilitator sugar transporter-like [Trinorchestia longiramus]|nr:Major facilitator sugar transporter-like [Trinorchestia longiramus]
MAYSEERDIDDILDILGTGKWNIFIFILCGLSAFRMPPQMLSASYVVPAVNYTCAVSLAEVSSSFSSSAGLTGGITAEQETSANRYSDGRNLTRNASRSMVQEQCEYYDQQQQLRVPCERWVYSDSVFHTTITSAYDLVCGRSYLRSMYTSTYMFGAMIGSVCVGYMADWKGRKLPLALSLVGYAISPLAMSWIPALEVILLCRFLLGFFHPLLLTSFYTIALEVTQPKYRATVGVLTALPWAIGTIAWAGLGYLIRDWQWLILTATVPSFLFIPCIWLVDESPRWLVVHGHHDEALKIFKKAAKINRSELPSEAELLNIMEITQKNAAINDTARIEVTISAFKRRIKEMIVLFSTRALRLRTFTMWVLFFVASMVFYGLSLSAVSLSADPFIYMAVGGLMEVPAYTITVPIIDFWGRRLPTALSYFVCGVNILALTFIPTRYGWLIITLAMVGKLGISMAYQIVYMYILELLPTEVRLQGLGSCMVASRVGSILSPFITDFLGESYPWLPPTIFGMASLVAGTLTLILPETNKQHMPDTVAELEHNHIAISQEENLTEKKVTIDVPEMEEDITERPSKFKRIRNWRQQTGPPRKMSDSDIPLRRNPEFTAKEKEKQSKHPSAIDEEESSEAE